MKVRFFELAVTLVLVCALAWTADAASMTDQSSPLPSQGNSDLLLTGLREKPVVWMAAVSGSEVSLQWEHIPSVSCYQVYRSDRLDGAYELIGQCGEAWFLDAGVSEGKCYFYKVGASIILDGATYCGPLSEPVAVATLDAPSITSVQTVRGGVLLSWSSVPGADRYNIYRAESAEGPYHYVESVVVRQYHADQGAVGGGAVYYKVRPYLHSEDDVVCYGGWSEQVCAEAPPSLPLTVSYEEGNALILTWAQASGASFYEVWAGREPGEIQKLLLTEALTFRHEELQAGHRYYYRVIAKDAQGEFVTESAVRTGAFLSTPVITSARSTWGGIKLGWTRAPATDRYNIYRAESADGPYRYLASVVGALQFTDSQAQCGVTYYYKVRPYTRVDKVVYYGGWSDPVMGTRQDPQTYTARPWVGLDQIPGNGLNLWNLSL